MHCAGSDLARNFCLQLGQVTVTPLLCKMERPKSFMFNMSLLSNQIERLTHRTSIANNIGGVVMEKTTSDLTQELLNRAGIELISVNPYEKAQIKTDTTIKEIVGPALILINQD